MIEQRIMPFLFRTPHGVIQREEFIYYVACCDLCNSEYVDMAAEIPSKVVLQVLNLGWTYVEGTLTCPAEAGGA